VEKVNKKIFVVIPCFNNLDVLKESIPSIYSDLFSIVIFNDGSTDGTETWIKKNYPKIHTINGDGSNWWTGSLKKGIDYCIEKQADYIVSLNADVLITPDVIKKLINCSQNNSDAIIASLVVDINNPLSVLWTGSKFCKIHKYIPIYSSRYILKAGKSISESNSNPYLVDEVHGRGVLIPAKVFKRIGNYDSNTFQHYGGDTDFSFSAKQACIKMLVDPSCIAKVFVENTSINKNENGSITKKIISIKNYLIDRKSGEALKVWWNLYKRHLPYRYFLQSFLFVILLNIYRRLV
jgi:GT2 family glycosyltransferase